MNDRLAKGKTARENLNNPAFYDARKAARSLKAKKSYEKRRLNGNAGWRPKSAEHREKMEKQKDAAAYAVAQLAAGVVPKTRRGRRASKATMARTVAEAVKAWMSASAAKDAAEWPTLPSPDLEVDVAALALSKTKEVLATVAAGGLLEKDTTLASWANETSSIALEGVGAWRLAWEEATAGRSFTVAAAATGDDGVDEDTREGLNADMETRLKTLLQQDKEFGGAVSGRAYDEHHCEVVPVVSHGPDKDEPATNIATADVVGVAPRRRRGRPRESSAVVLAAEIPDATATTGRQLPRPKMESPHVGDGDGASAATTVPRRPGRPRKKPLLPSVEAVGVSGATADVQNGIVSPTPFRPRINGAGSDVGSSGVDGTASSNANAQGVGVWQEKSPLSFAVPAKEGRRRKA